MDKTQIATGQIDLQTPNPETVSKQLRAGLQLVEAAIAEIERAQIVPKEVLNSIVNAIN